MRTWCLKFFRKTKKATLKYYYDTSGRIVFVQFFEELRIPKSTFEINWPLSFWQISKSSHDKFSEKWSFLSTSKFLSNQIVCILHIEIMTRVISAVCSYYEKAVPCAHWLCRAKILDLRSLHVQFRINTWKIYCHILV